MVCTCNHLPGLKNQTIEVEIDKESEFFNKYIREEGEYDVFDERAYIRLLGLIKKRLNPISGKKWLDMGCGTGAFTSKLKKFDGSISGVDISEESIKVAKFKNKNFSFYCEDIRNTTLESGSFDFVIFSGVLHHLKEYNIIHDALKEAFRLLKPGGYVFSFDPHECSPAMFLYRDPRSPLYSSKDKTENEILMSRKKLQHELKFVGFDKIIIEGISGITYKKVPGKAVFLLPLYNFLDKILQHSPFENLLGTFLIASATKP